MTRRMTRTSTWPSANAHRSRRSSRHQGRHLKSANAAPAVVTTGHDTWPAHAPTKSGVCPMDMISISVNPRGGVVWSYIWKPTHRAMNKKYHAEHGNGTSTKLISKLTIEGLPSLSKEADDPSVFMEYAIDMRSWAIMNNVTDFTVGPAVAVPHGEEAAASAIRLAKNAEGVRYICASISDPDLRSTVASGAGTPPMGPTAYGVLRGQFLQGTDEQPTIMNILDNMKLRRDQSVVAFRSRWTKFALALDPQPAQRILSQKFCRAVTAGTGDMYMQCAISSITDPAAQDNYGAYSALLTRLCTQQKQFNETEATVKAMKATTEPTSAGKDKVVKALENKVATLEKRLEKTKFGPDDRGGRRDDRRTGDRDRPKRQCHKCGEFHDPITCKANPVCDWHFGNGDKCGGCHLRKFCWHEDPTRCRDPKLRRLIERRVEAKSKPSSVSSHQTTVDFNSFWIKVVLDGEEPEDYFKDIPAEIITEFIMPELDDESAVAMASTSSANKDITGYSIAVRVSDAYDEAWKNGYSDPPSRKEVANTWDRAIARQMNEMLRNGSFSIVDMNDTHLKIPSNDHAVFHTPVDMPVIAAHVQGHTQPTIDDYLLVDTGTADHIVCDHRLLINPSKHEPAGARIITGAGECIAKSRGPAAFTFKDKDGKPFTIIREVLYVPDFTVNLFSPAKDWRDHGTRASYEDICTLTFKGDGGATTIVPFTALDDTFRLYYDTTPISSNQNEVLVFPDKTDAFSIWHRRFGHAGFESIQKLPRFSIGAEFGATAAEVEEHRRSCPICPLARMQAKPHSRNLHPTRLVGKFGDRIHMDLAGPIQPVSYYHGHRYVSLFVDEYSTLIKVYGLANKRETDQIKVHKLFCADMASVGGMEVKEFHSDNGGEYIGKYYAELITEGGAKKTTIIAKHPNMNPIAEGTFWRLFGMARGYLFDSGLPKSFWYYAIEAAAYSLNRLPKRRSIAGSTTFGASPFEMVYGHPPNVKHMRIFGCLAHILVPKLDRTSKLNEVAKTGFYVGPATNQRGYNVWIPSEDKVIAAHSVRFDEHTMYKNVHTAPKGEEDEDEDWSDETESSDDGEPKASPKPKKSRKASRALPGKPSSRTRSQTSAATAGVGSHHTGTTTNKTIQDFKIDDQGYLKYETEDAIQSHFTQEIGAPDGIDVIAMVAGRKDHKLIHTDEGSVLKSIPKNYDEATRGPDAEKWRDAMKTELASHHDAPTWELIPMSSVKKGKKLVGSTWAFDLKRTETGRIDRYKARLCAQGFSQLEGVDFINTYSNTVHHNTLRSVLAIAAMWDLILTGADVKTAYLYGYIEEDITIYMRQPRGFEQYTKDGEPMVCRLIRSIYGLRQSGARWEARLIQELTKMGFVRSNSDPCLHVIRKGKDLLILCVYVDDLIFASSSDGFRKHIFDQLAATFQIKDTGPLTWMLNTNISQDLKARTVSISQKLYIEDCVKTFFPEGVPKEGSKRVTPCDEDISTLEPLADGELIDPQYRSGVGKLVWLVAISRPDVAYVHSMLARHNQAAGKRHMQALLKVFAYLGRTSHYKITYGPQQYQALNTFIETHSQFKASVLDVTSIVCMTDSSHGGERPMAGDVLFANGGPFAWHAYRHPGTPLSVMQGEYQAATKAVVEILATRENFKLLGIDVSSPTVIFCDNLSAVQLSDGNTPSKRMKHIATRIAFLREQVKDGTIMLYHVGTLGQISDIFTKACPPAIFHALRAYLLG